jgi:hypothetical protein
MNDLDPLLDKGPREPGPFPGPALSARQRRLFERLVDLKQPVGTSLGQMYLGALVALDSAVPDALAHSAHSSRELIEKVLRVGEGPDEKSPGTHPARAGVEAQDAWGEYRRAYGVEVVELAGRTVDRDLLGVLVRLDRYREAGVRHERSRKGKIRRAMRELALGDVGLPEAIRERDVRFVYELWSFFDGAAHH